MNVKDHYENHLGNFYSWMLGDFSQRQEEQEAYFKKNNIIPHFGKKALDFNTQLTTEVEKRAEGLNIEVFPCDFTDGEALAKFRPELIVCMGDTITHLESIGQVTQLVADVNANSENNALFIVSYRDLTKELTDEHRFIPVKADEERILTCFLEYFPEYVKVSDILFENEAGTWKQKVSCYKKLRLNIEMLRNIFACNNFHLINLEITRGMTYLIFSKK
jgi:hypothetical protein